MDGPYRTARRRAALWLPGVVRVEWLQQGVQPRAGALGRIHVGGSAGWLVLRPHSQRMTWNWPGGHFVAKSSLSADTRACVGLLLPEHLLDARAYPNVLRAARACSLVRVDARERDGLLRLGARVYTVRVEARPEVVGHLRAEGGGEAVADLDVRAGAPPLGKLGELAPLGAIELAMLALSDGALEPDAMRLASTLWLELAARGVERAARLGCWEQELVQVIGSGAGWEPTARALATAVTTPSAGAVVPVPFYGEAQRVVQRAEAAGRVREVASFVVEDVAFEEEEKAPRRAPGPDAVAAAGAPLPRGGVRAGKAAKGMAVLLLVAALLWWLVASGASGAP